MRVRKFAISGTIALIALMLFLPHPALAEGPRVKHFQPGNEARDIPVDVSIIIVFSGPMNSTSVEGMFRTIPPVSGSFSWDTNGDTLTFKPSKPLDNSVTYMILIEPDVTDTNGTPMGETEASEFTTAAVAFSGGIYLLATLLGLIFTIIAAMLMARTKHIESHKDINAKWVPPPPPRDTSNGAVCAFKPVESSVGHVLESGGPHGHVSSPGIAPALPAVVPENAVAPTAAPASYQTTLTGADNGKPPAAVTTPVTGADRNGQEGARTQSGLEFDKILDALKET